MAVGIGETFSVEYQRFSGNEIKKFVSTSLVFPVVVFFAASVALLFFGNFFQTKTGLSGQLLFLVILLSLLSFFNDYILIVLRNQNKPFFFASFSFIKTLIELFLAVVFVKYLHKGAMGRIESIFYTSLLGFIFMLAFFLRYRLLAFTFSKKWMLIMLKRGLPAIPLFFMIFILGSADKYMINYYYGQELVGLYGLGWQFAMMLTLLTSAFITPFYPYLYQRLESREYDKIIKISAGFIAVLLVGIAVMLFALPFFFDLMIAPKFHRSLQYIPYMVFGQLFWALFLLVCGYIYYERKNSIFYYLSPAVIVSTLLINYLFLVKYPVDNFAIVSFLSYLFCFLIEVFILRNHLKKAVPIIQYSFISLFKKNHDNVNR